MKRRYGFAMLCLFALTSFGCAEPLYQAMVPKVDANTAEARFEDNIALLEPVAWSGQKISIKDVVQLCEAYYNVKNFEKTNLCIERAKEIYNSGDKTGWLGTDVYGYIVNISANAYIENGKFNEAINVSKAYIDSNRNSMHRGFLVNLLSSYGLACALNKDEQKSMSAINDLEAIYLGFPFDGIQEFRDRGEAKIYLALGKGKEAYAVINRYHPLFTLAKGIASSMYVTNDKFYYMELPLNFMRAKAAYESGHLEEARRGYDALLAVGKARLNGEVYWQLLFDRGRIAEADGQLDPALGFYVKAIDVVEQQRKTIGSDASKIGFVGDKQALYQSVVDVLIRLGQPSRAFEFVERGKSRALVDLLADRQDITGQGNLADANATLMRLAELDQRYSYIGGAAQGDKTQLRSALASTRDQLRQAEPELASLVTVSAPRAVEIQAQLRPDETLLEYYGQGDTLYAFVVTSTGIKVHKLDAKGLEADVRALREALRDTRSEAWKPLAEQLHNRLMTPVAGAFDRPKLIIVSHGALHYLPFNALFDGQRFLVDKVAVQLLPSASVMQFLAARKTATARDMLLLGNPDLGRPDMDLPGAEAEARAIKGLWPNSTMLMRKTATKAALTRAGQLFRVIHVAAHGEFSSDQPLNSRLLLSPEGDDNGQLTAGDLYGLRLNADLVTLSACETGLGKVLSGDDVVGLTRGFLYAGANSIVASLWPVSDDETKFLMTSFYTNLKKLPKADALRQAQLETKKRYPHPFFWSAFQLTGMGR